MIALVLAVGLSAVAPINGPPSHCDVPPGEYCVCSAPESNVGRKRRRLFCSVVEDAAWGFYVEYTFERKNEAIFLMDGARTVIFARSNPDYPWWRRRR